MSGDGGKKANDTGNYVQGLLTSDSAGRGFGGVFTQNIGSCPSKS